MESQVNQLEISGCGRRLRITKCISQSRHIIADHGADLPAQREASTFISPPPLVQARTVGTFYRESAPDQTPYVKKGEVIAPGQVLCVLEAMKMMNEIQAEVGGRVADIFVENGQPVEYNQVFSIGKSVVRV